MSHLNPALCAAALPLAKGWAYCELPAGHPCPHRASGEPHVPSRGITIHWGERVSFHPLAHQPRRPDAA